MTHETFALNWRRGLIRFWCVASVCWWGWLWWHESTARYPAAGGDVVLAAFVIPGLVMGFGFGVRWAVRGFQHTRAEPSKASTPRQIKTGRWSIEIPNRLVLLAVFLAVAGAVAMFAFVGKVEAPTQTAAENPFAKFARKAPAAAAPNYFDQFDEPSHQ